MVSRNYVTAVLTLVAAIVGVGMFTLPYVASKAGLLTVFAFFIILGVIQHWLHKLYAEVVLSTREMHRLPGYADKYLRPHSKKLVLLLTMFGSYGSLLAYTIIGGNFLHQLLNPFWGGSVFLYTTILLLIRGFIIFFGFKWITRAEVILTAGLIGTVLIIAAVTSGSGLAENFTFFNAAHAILPYGPVFFAVGGVIAINDIVLIMKNEKENIKSALFWGLLISIAIMITFTVMVMSLSGAATTPDSLSGLKPFVTPAVYAILLLVGLISVTTSFLAVAEAMEESYMWDFKVHPTVAWLLVVILPYLLFLTGAQDLTKVIAVTGAISGGLIGALTLSLVLHVKKKPEIKSPLISYLTPGLAHALSLLFLFGLLYQLWEVFG